MTWQTPLYTFLEYCDASPHEKEVLDCGAGISGEKVPPLMLFHENGYKTYGIDISDARIRAAERYAREKGIDLGITRGDMRRIPFEEGSISFAYAYNTIFHMSKSDITAAMNEVFRVLRPGGLCFVNFFSIEHGSFRKGEEVGEGEYLYDEYGEPMIHSFFEDYEADPLFRGMEIVHREKRRDIGTLRRAFIDYIARLRE